MARPQRQLSRVLALLRLLDQNPGPWTWDGLAAALSVTTRTVRRDVEALSHCGAKWVVTQQGRGPSQRWFKGWMTERGVL